MNSVAELQKHLNVGFLFLDLYSSSGNGLLPSVLENKTNIVCVCCSQKRVMGHNWEASWSQALLRCSICLDLVGASRLVVVTIWSSPFPLHQSACNRHCRSCDSQGSCTSCRDPSKVLLFGECQYESCAPQYYLDISTKTCKGKAFPELCEDSFIQGCVFALVAHLRETPSSDAFCVLGYSNQDICVHLCIHWTNYFSYFKLLDTVSHIGKHARGSKWKINPSVVFPCST